MPRSDDTQALIARGDGLRDGGKFDAALAIYDAVVAADQGLALGHFKRGTALAGLGRPDEVEEAYLKALELSPDYPEAANNLAVLKINRGNWDEAEELLRKVLAQHLDYFDAHNNLADALLRRSKNMEALYYARRAFQLNPVSPFAVERVAAALNALGRMHESAEFAAENIQKVANYAALWSTYGISLQGLGRHADADRAHDKAIELAGTQIAPRMIRLFFSNYLSISKEEIWQRHKEFGRFLRDLTGPENRDFANIVRDPERRLNVGIVSGDFRRHSVSYFVPGAFEQLDHSKFRLYAYSVSHYADNDTLRLKPLFKVWRNVARLDNEALYRQIRDDRIDILVDLSGHTNESRLAMFSRRPAPVQISYMGYPNTTGLDVIDYRLTDVTADPPGVDEEFYSETLWRLNRCFLCYTPLSNAPDVAERSGAGAPVVFGSFNTRAKYSDACVAAWIELLRRMPEARMVIKSVAGNGDAAGRQEFVERFAAAGVDPSRVEMLEGTRKTEDHLANYAKIDIALDTFPYNGTTTTFEALWMGVPVITLNGDRHASRVGASILHGIGLDELVAGSAEHYIELAAALAGDLPRCRELRRTLRGRMASSLLLDRPAMGEAMGQAMRQMWQRYCHGQEVHGSETVPVAESDAIEIIRLHIGGREPRVGWKILDVEERPEVDFVTDIRDLSMIEDDSCSEIYMSHVLEHIALGEVLPVLSELHRIMLPGGKLYLAVPDTEVLAELMTSPDLDTPQKFEVMRMMFGEQAAQHDFHSIGFTFDFLADYLAAIEFASVEYVESFGLFDDDSERVCAGRRVSLNLLVTK
jgi:predicted O-linked N-acetylglucosamine transferase (SPINDLY family)/predicted SAM-dependent methyltransferase